MLFEDLRHPIPVAVWIEVFSTATNIVVTVPSGTVPPFSNESSGESSGVLCSGDLSSQYEYDIHAQSTIFEGSLSNPGFCYPNNEIDVVTNNLFPQLPGPVYKSHKTIQTIEARWLLGSIISSISNGFLPTDPFYAVTNTYAYSTGVDSSNIGANVPFSKKPKQVSANTNIDLFFNYSYNGISGATIPIVTNIPQGWGIEMEAVINLTFWDGIVNSSNQFNIYGVIQILKFGYENLPQPAPPVPFSTQIYQRQYVWAGGLPISYSYPITNIIDPTDAFFGKSGFHIPLVNYLGATGLNLLTKYMVFEKTNLTSQAFGNYIQVIGYHDPGGAYYNPTSSYTDSFVFEFEGYRVKFK